MVDQNIPLQFRYLKLWNRFSCGLADIKYCRNPESCNDTLYYFCFRLSIFPDHNLASVRISLFNLLFLFIWSRGNDLDALFPSFYLPVEFLLPCLIPCYQCRFRFLHGDQQCIIKTVIMELCHCVQIFRIFF